MPLLLDLLEVLLSCLSQESEIKLLLLLLLLLENVLFLVDLPEPFLSQPSLFLSKPIQTETPTSPFASFP